MYRFTIYIYLSGIWGMLITLSLLPQICQCLCVCICIHKHIHKYTERLSFKIQGFLFKNKIPTLYYDSDCTVENSGLVIN